MKGLLYFLSFMLLLANGFSQITITGANFPLSGYTYLTSTDTTPVISLGTPGPSAQAWNYSSLSMDYPSVPTYGSTSWTPYASAFPTSNLYTYGPAALYSSLFGGAPVNSQGMGKGYMFWKSDNTGFWAVGFRADSGTYANINVNYSPEELLIGAPCTYNSSFNNTGRWVLPMNVNSLDVDTYYVCRTVKMILCDAWGSLTTPFSTFPSVIRQHETVTKYDSVYAKMGSVVVSSLELARTTSNNYIYLSNTINYPACIVHADVNNLIKDVEWYNGYLASVSENALPDLGIHVSPVPLTDASILELNIPSEMELSISIHDISGRLILHEPPLAFSAGLHSIPIHLGTLAPGVYLLELRSGNITRTLRILR